MKMFKWLSSNDKWINANKKLPETSDFVLVTNGSHVSIARYHVQPEGVEGYQGWKFWGENIVTEDEEDYDVFEMYKDCKDICDCGVLIGYEDVIYSDEVTHWYPFPKL